jgi:hypothetical protein
MAFTMTSKKEAVLRFVKFTQPTLPSLNILNRVAGFVLPSAYDVMVFAGDK